METSQNKISALLGKPVQYVLPMFQRPYSWGEKQWKKLWGDIVDIRRNPHKPEHFLGTIVVLQEDSLPGKPPKFLLIDGQQRLTTFSLILTALRDLIRKSDADSSLAKKIENRFLIDPDETGDYRFKIMPTQDDIYPYQTLVLEGRRVDKSQLEEGYAFFLNKLGELLEGKSDQAAFFDGMFSLFSDSFVLVTIQLSKGENAYRIFESLNATGLSLTQADLVRNYIFMRLSELPKSEQKGLYELYWHPIEKLLSDKRTVGRSNIGELTGFLRHYLAVESGELENKSDVYFQIRAKLDNNFSETSQLVSELKRLSALAQFYDRFLRPDGDTEIGGRLKTLTHLDSSTAFPFLLQVFEAHATGILDSEEVCEVLDTLENYIVRRYLCDEPTNYMNKMFAGLYSKINESAFVRSFKEVLADRNYPRDHRIFEILPKLKLYGRADRLEKLRVVLERIEMLRWDKKEAVPSLSDAVSVEHVLPQTPTDDWKSEVGDSFDRVYADLCDTIGNLTLTGRNSELGNRPFREKREWLARSEFKLNEYFRDVPRWDEAAILQRSKMMATLAITAWPEFNVTFSSAESSYKSPIRVVIKGDSFEVRSWRDVVYQVSEYVVNNSGDNFVEIAAKFPSLFIDPASPRVGVRKLQNGYSLRLNMSADSARKVSLRLLRAVGIDPEEFDVQIE